MAKHVIAGADILFHIQMSAAYPFVLSTSTMLWQSLLFPDTSQMVALLCKKKIVKHVRRCKSNPRFHIQHKRMNKFRPIGVVDPPRKIWGKWAQFLHECASTIPEHRAGRDPKKHWALLSTPGSGVCLCASACVCVKLPTVAIDAFLKTQSQNLPYKLAQAPPPDVDMHACAHIANTYASIFFSSSLSPPLTCARQKWHTDASTDGTHRPFLSLTAVFWYQTEPAEGEQTRWRGKISWSHSVAVHANTHRHKRTHKCMRRFCLDVKWLPALRRINRRQRDSTLQDFH